MSTNFKGRVQSFIKKIKRRVNTFYLSSMAASFCGMTLFSAYAVGGFYADGNSQNDFSTVSNQEETTISTMAETEKETNSAMTTYVTTTCVTTTYVTTTTTATETTTAETTSTETTTTTSSSTEATTIELETSDEIEIEEVYEIETVESSDAVSNEVYYDSDERTRPYISTGAERLASMMANEGGSSDITCLRTGIGFMNRIHSSLFPYETIEEVSGYCFSTPNQHQIDLANEVISAYNDTDAAWYQYCVDHSLTDKTVFHHNGTTPQSFEQPGGFIEYGDTGWYKWTLLYSESIYDHY